MSFEELEYKYRADGISLGDFLQLITTQDGHLITHASWDVYYLQEGNDNSFQRFRMDRDNPELTKKVKVNDSNNWKRIESDLPLDPARITEEKVAFHVGLDGYKKNFKIYKHCTIYFTENLNYVYYVVFDENMKETGRFIEVEVNKDKVSTLSLTFPGGPEGALREGEKFLGKLGLSAQNRLKKSLFELYRKLP